MNNNAITDKLSKMCCNIMVEHFHLFPVVRHLVATCKTNEQLDKSWVKHLIVNYSGLNYIVDVEYNKIYSCLFSKCNKMDATDYEKIIIESVLVNYIDTSYTLNRKIDELVEILNEYYE